MRSADNIHVELVLSKSIVFSIVGVYRFQDFSEDCFLNELDNLVCNIKNQNVIFAGDINLNLLNLNKTTESYLIKMASYGLEPKISEPTRVANNSATLIDHIFLRHSLGVDVDTEAWVLDTDVTDHRATVICVKCQQKINNHPKHTIHLNKLNYHRLNALLTTVDWHAVYISNSVSGAFEEFIHILECCIKKSQQLKNNKEKKLRKLKPWMTDSLLKMVIKKIQCTKD